MHETYLKQACSLAETRQGFCSPNPPVGAVIVKNNRVLSTGIHYEYGSPHAEVDALKQLGNEAQGATIYITLEPCCHWGKTPPCTQLLIDRSIKEVIYGFVDPNPLVAGKGQNILKAAGINCRQIPIPEINELYQSYQYWHQTKLPVVIAKLAMSLDGKIAGPQRQPLTITGPQLQALTHQWRKKSDAILTTINTIVHDDPQLNARVDERYYPKALYILDSQLNIPVTAKIFTTAKKITLFHHPEVSTDKVNNLINHGVRCWAVSSNETGLNLSEVLTNIGHDGHHTLWVEAGARCFKALIEQQLIHRALIYVAPKVLGQKCLSAFYGDENFLESAQQIHWNIVGQDVVCDIKFK